MLETIAPPGATVTPGPLGVVDFGNIAALLGVSQQTLERLTRTDATFPKLFKIGNRRHCRFADIQSWIDRKAKGDAYSGPLRLLRAETTPERPQTLRSLFTAASRG
jgi:predicted DNA-binding transcriptional regulator AlpA